MFFWIKLLIAMVFGTIHYFTATQFDPVILIFYLFNKIVGGCALRWLLNPDLYLFSSQTNESTSIPVKFYRKKQQTMSVW